MKSLSCAMVAAGIFALPAHADYFIAGDFNGWNAAGSAMTDLGGGIWQATLSGVGGRHEMKITVGDWSQNWPGSGNSWFVGDGEGSVTITFNANDVQDGWRGTWGRIGTSTDPGAWTAVGDWQGWNNTGNAMIPLGGGIYHHEQTLAPGWYQWKAVVTGTWDSIGDDFRGVNSDNTWFEVTADNPTAVFEVNALAGTGRVYTVPEASGTALLGAAMACACCRRRRR